MTGFSRRRNTSTTRLVVALSTLGVGLASLAVLAGSAAAKQVVTHVYATSFTGATSTAGPFGSEISDVAVDEETGDVYTLTKQFILSKYDEAGTPRPFTASSLQGANAFRAISGFEAEQIEVRLAVDNSHTPTQGRLYVTYGNFPNETIAAFNPDGSAVGGTFPIHRDAARSVGVDPTNGDFWIGGSGNPNRRFTPDGSATNDELPLEALEDIGYNVRKGGMTVGIDGDQNYYLSQIPEQFFEYFGGIEKYDSSRKRLYNIRASGSFGRTYPEFAVDPVSNDIYSLANSGNVIQYSQSGNRFWEFGGGTLSSAYNLAVNGSNEKVYVARGGEAGKVDIYAPGPNATVPTVALGGVSDVKPTSVKMLGTVDPEGQATTGCHFEWSIGYSFVNSAPCAEGVLNGSGDQQVSAMATEVEQGKTYHYRLVVGNSNGPVETINNTFIPSDVPRLGLQWTNDVHSDSARLNVEISPEGIPTTFRVQYGPENCSVSTCSESLVEDAGKGKVKLLQGTVLTGLDPATTYHYRVAAVNQLGTVYGPDQTFTTYQLTKIPPDKCANAHVRQQVSAALLPECRAYELVSAADTGGYSVESDIVAGQHPFGGYPDAAERVLYGVHSGAIPGPWVATNHGVDPYVATRGPDGWSTDYYGIPANNPYATGPFSSALDEANSFLTAFAFGGDQICAPCFADGSSGIPLRESDGSFVQGMQGQDDSGPGAESDGFVRKRFSADGSHLIFGSTSKFAEGGNDETGDVSIYDRNLETGDTQVVSNDTAGNTLACLQGAGKCHSPGAGDGIAELGVSADGSRIVVGQLISKDSKGNRYFHLFMHVGQTPESIDLTPGTTAGVQYDGMTDDGSSVFFTTTDPLTTPTDQDTDTSADIFRADVDGTIATISRVSTGEAGTGNTDACDPSGEPENWNVPFGEDGKCGALAFAGGSGAASQSGAFYFLSPEKLDTSDSADQPVQEQANLYYSERGAAPRFVAVMDATDGKAPRGPYEHPRLNSDFAGTVSGAQAMTVDQSDGDLYVAFPETGEVRRFDSSGAPKNFTAGPAAGTNALTGLGLAEGYSEVEIAVDNSGGPLNGTLYVTESQYSYLDIAIFSPDGTPRGKITGAATSFGQFFSQPCGVTVDQSDGSVYVGDGAYFLWRYKPNSPSGEITDNDYTVTGMEGRISPCQVAADNGLVYAAQRANGPLVRYNATSFASNPPFIPNSTQVSEAATAVSTDSTTHYVYVNEGERISAFDPSGALVERFATGDFSESRGIAVRSADRHVFAVRGGSRVAEYGYAPPPYTPIDNTAVVHARTQPETHSASDIQVTPDGHFAVFPSSKSLTGHDNGGFYELFRYDSQGGELACASCNPTNSRTVGDASLATAGLSLLSDGTVFFNSDDPLAPRDLDGRQDVYEWRGSGTPDLISTGGSPFDSSLLTASSDGTDAFFFTRDTLVPQDKNGNLTKIYDARSGGGFEFLPAPERCKASDECHGAGSEPPGALPVATGAGAGGAHKAAKPTNKPCRKGGKHRGKRHGKRCTSAKHHHKKRGNRR